MLGVYKSKTKTHNTSTKQNLYKKRKTKTTRIGNLEIRDLGKCFLLISKTDEENFRAFAIKKDNFDEIGLDSKSKWLFFGKENLFVFKQNGKKVSITPQKFWNIILNEDIENIFDKTHPWLKTINHNLEKICNTINNKQQGFAYRFVSSTLQNSLFILSGSYTFTLADIAITTLQSKIDKISKTTKTVPLQLVQNMLASLHITLLALQSNNPIHIGAALTTLLSDYLTINNSFKKNELARLKKNIGRLLKICIDVWIKYNQIKNLYSISQEPTFKFLGHIKNYFKSKNSTLMSKKLKNLMEKTNNEVFVELLKKYIKNQEFKTILEQATPEDKNCMQNLQIPSKQLIPTQNEIDIEKTFKYALTQISKGKSINEMINTIPPIITAEEKYVLDGHHRWSQAILLNPNAKIKTIDLKIATPSKALKTLHLASAYSKGEVNVKFVSGQNLLNITKEAFTSWFNKANQTTNEINIKTIWNNIQQMQQNNQPTPNALNRGFMPQTDKTIIKNLELGKLNVNAPY